MTIEPVKEEHKEELFQMHELCFREHIDQIWGWDDVWQREYFDKEWQVGEWRVMVESGQIIGCLMWRLKCDHLYLHNISLLPKFRGEGRGSEAMKYILSKANALKLGVKLSTFQTNEQVISFYERLGFSVIEQKENGKLLHRPFTEKTNRIMVIGCCGAGKSTLSFRLAEHFDLPVYHLDKLFWKAGWVQTEKEEWIAKHEKMIEKPQWIIDGNFSSTMSDRLEKADLVICMDMPRWQCFWGIFKRRWMYRGKSRPDMTEGCPERINWEFLKYVWDFHRDARPLIMEKLAAYNGLSPVHILKSRKEVRHFLEQITQKRTTNKSDD